MSGVHSPTVSRVLRFAAAFALTTAVTATGLVALTGAQANTVPPTPVSAPVTAAPSPGDVPPSQSIGPSDPLPPSPTGATPDPSTLRPTAPTNLVATSVTTYSVTLTWTASTSGCCDITGYEIWHGRRFYDVIWVTPVGNVTTVTIRQDIQPTMEYTFWMAAKDSAGRSSWSSNSVRLVTPRSDTGPDTTPPTGPKDLAITPLAAGGAQLTWSPSTDNVGVTGYNVYTFDGAYIVTHVGTVTGTSFTARSYPPRYQLFVRATDAAGNISVTSATVSATTTNPDPSTPSPTPLTCRVAYTMSAQWDGGFVAAVTVTNTGTQPINGWTLAFPFGGDQQIRSSWNTTFTQTGGVVKLKNLDWNSVIPAGGSATVGMQGSWTASNTPPAAFSVNQVRCAAG